MVGVIENRFHVFKNKKNGTKLVLVFPCFCFFQNKNQFLNRLHVFVRECFVSVIENRFHVFKNNKNGTKLVPVLSCSCFFRIKTSF